MVYIPYQYGSVVAYSKTATDDNQFRMFEADLWLREANIHVVTNDCKYGDTSKQDATASAGDILCFQDFNLADLYFKNSGAGANTTIYVVGIVMSEGRKKELQLTIKGT